MNILKKKPVTFVVVIMGGKAYDYPKHLPIPLAGSKISMDDIGPVTITYIQYDVTFDKKGRNVMNIITINTDL